MRDDYSDAAVPWRLKRVYGIAHNHNLLIFARSAVSRKHNKTHKLLQNCSHSFGAIWSIRWNPPCAPGSVLQTRSSQLDCRGKWTSQCRALVRPNRAALAGTRCTMRPVFWAAESGSSTEMLQCDYARCSTAAAKALRCIAGRWTLACPPDGSIEAAAPVIWWAVGRLASIRCRSRPAKCIPCSRAVSVTDLSNDCATGRAIEVYAAHERHHFQYCSAHSMTYPGIHCAKGDRKNVDGIEWMFAALVDGQEWLTCPDRRRMYLSLSPSSCCRINWSISSANIGCAYRR